MLIWDLAQYTLKLSPCFFAVQFEATWQLAARKLAAHPADQPSAPRAVWARAAPLPTARPSPIAKTVENCTRREAFLLRQQF